MTVYELIKELQTYNGNSEVRLLVFHAKKVQSYENPGVVSDSEVIEYLEDIETQHRLKLTTKNIAEIKKDYVKCDTVYLVEGALHKEHISTIAVDCYYHEKYLLKE